MAAASRLLPGFEPAPELEGARPAVKSSTRRRTRNPSPAMRQYLDLKREVGDAILFFRMGDFYEVFFEDAEIAGRILNIAVTSRQADGEGKAIPMAGVPHHAAEAYIARLVRAGHRVAVCEQMEAAGLSRGPVRREIVRTVTPSTYLDPAYLAGSEAAYLMAVAETAISGSGGGEQIGAAWVDLSTGDFAAAEFSGRNRYRECAEATAAFHPRELLAAEGNPPSAFLSALGAEPLLTGRPGLWFEFEHARDTLLRHFGTVSLESYGIETMPGATCAAGAAISYLAETQRGSLGHLGALRRLDTAGRMLVDPVTQRHLEIFEPLAPPVSPKAPARATLVATLDRTATGMGARLLRRRLAQPLLDPEAIGAAHLAVEEWTRERPLSTEAQGPLDGCPDLERLAARISLRLAGPREYRKLSDGLSAVADLKRVLGSAASALLAEVAERLDPLPELAGRIRDTISPDAPVLVRDGGAIREGVSSDLDELRRVRFHGRESIRDMETRERERTGIGSLRIRHNQVFGYTIEVPKGQAGRVPSNYLRRQTLVNAERYVTEELGEFEVRVARADEQIRDLEAQIFGDLEEEAGRAAARVLETAKAVAEADLTASFAAVALARGYVKPVVHEGFAIHVEGGRHPVVEALADERFVPNDLEFDEERFLMILTGPNMGGKSTFLRQTALHVLMAQAGSFVPAKRARLPVVDRVFARVGASDDLARGRSTFLTEMEETAHILHHASGRSLILLDEVGRGTSTYDGLSLAWAIVEHIARSPGLRAKTLFATHYHELTALAAREPGVVNFHVEAREHRDEIVFLRQVAPGGTDRSYGIEVARLAGVPKPVLRRAREVLEGLARGRSAGPADDGASREEPREPSDAAPAASPADPIAAQVAEALRASNPDELSPREALDLVYRLHRGLSGEDETPSRGAR